MFSLCKGIYYIHTSVGLEYLHKEGVVCIQVLEITKVNQSRL